MMVRDSRTITGQSNQVSSAPLSSTDLDEATDLRESLMPALTKRPGSPERREAIEQIAASQDVSSRTIRRWISAFESMGMVGLARAARKLPRMDKGAHRLPHELVQVVQSTLISNPPGTSIRKIHDIVTRGVPELALVPRKSGRVIELSVATVRRVRQEMLDDPTLRLLFADADARKEYIRTYSGQVMAAHGNDMWQMDMTRCDIMVYDPDKDAIYRPRVQAVIDVYSGCIMGISFSRREDQDQADLVLARSLMRKYGALDAHWPMRGVARRLYIDNGKTYKSAHFHRIVSGIGMEIIHSRPLVSHTRGKVERFFGTLHQVERALVGYCGENAAKRSNHELNRLYRNTLAWAREGRNVARHERLLTLAEYQEVILKWLVTDYHQTVVHGLTRLQHFVQTAPASTLIDLDLYDLSLLFARWEPRTVRSDGTVLIDKVAWTTPNGRLAQYQRMKVVVMTEAFALGDPRRLAAYEDRSGRFQMLGPIAPAPTAADSLEAAAQRRANRAATKEQLAEADGLRRELFNPAATYEAHLNRGMEDVIVQPAPLPAPRARLAALQPEAAPQPDLDGFGDFLKPAEDMDELLRRIREDN
ncbi:DDE-type integrase/transposase/recombinase [Deinococcus humi]|uniref:Putative transposase n=1 Tax=Deinococcus humi TaxID=662880 RepID=A0A7W8JU90_9DEIO|nr:DDE-type integrase/transposase/recombinase [Deinococcus humi]MBB5363055.1 putative transposase [Deinococcus humi]